MNSTHNQIHTIRNAMHMPPTSSTVGGSDKNEGAGVGGAGEGWGGGGGLAQGLGGWLC